MHVSTLENELQAMNVLGFLSFGGKKKLHFYNNKLHIYFSYFFARFSKPVKTDKAPF